MNIKQLRTILKTWDVSTVVAETDETTGLVTVARIARENKKRDWIVLAAIEYKGNPLAIAGTFEQDGVTLRRYPVKSEAEWAALSALIEMKNSIDDGVIAIFARTMVMIDDGIPINDDTVNMANRDTREIPALNWASQPPNDLYDPKKMEIIARHEMPELPGFVFAAISEVRKGVYVALGGIVYKGVPIVNGRDVTTPGGDTVREYKTRASAVLAAHSLLTDFAEYMMKNASALAEQAQKVDFLLATGQIIPEARLGSLFSDQ